MMESGIAGLLIDARRRANLTQQQLAERAHTAASAVSAYERGHRDPSLKTIQRLIEACGMELRLRADELTNVEMAQYARDRAVGPWRALENAARLRNQVVEVRALSEEERARLISGASA